MVIRLGLIATLFVAGCGDWLDADTGFTNYFSGQSCSPDPLTFVNKTDALKGQSNGNVSPTGIPGDNMDDLRSGKVDCLYDGNSGQGDDWKYPQCTPEDFPQPGCDGNGCCEDCDHSDDPDDVDEDPPDPDDYVPDPPPPDDPEDPPPEEDPV